MRDFAYHRADDAAGAVALVAADPDARFLGGGTNLVDHLKLGITSPGTLVDVSRLPLDQVEELPDGGLRVGTNVRNSDLAAHPAVRRDFPGVARALLAGASGQIRHQATTGGNLLQRTRCVYFQDVTTPCNKRDPGSGCSALEGYGRYNAVLGLSEACVTTHPSDLAVALAAADATVVVLGPEGERRIPLVDLHRLPGHHPERDTVLEHGDLITAVQLPASAVARNATYRKARDRASYAFALVSVAAGLELDGEVVRDVRIAWGGVAHKPWRALLAEEALRGAVLTEDAVREAASAELAAATVTAQTAYKVDMVRNLTALALTRLAEGTGR
ncbi:xanthine dehydrogenase family protein subunit M [Nocardioides sp. ChNu-153]|uniref:FAD binding domain-containing protein n=1 Tax=unclassified Nocardioides TaxID=2615069 RepID=UPI0024050DCD|nr:MULTISPECIES: xanthine dehydrogenase family protein subunit M [unclassified Nocardioides]MDF9715657.1 xanthine dehydrogenase family protein subunit M [Nocardioides sp. ChNu-99]MDN7121641.1 xanthine dehydrogenase family protein subunit M [Nocardioides sp. ChNu-153]